MKKVIAERNFGDTFDYIKFYVITPSFWLKVKDYDFGRYDERSGANFPIHITFTRNEVYWNLELCFGIGFGITRQWSF